MSPSMKRLIRGPVSWKKAQVAPWDPPSWLSRSTPQRSYHKVKSKHLPTALLVPRFGLSMPSVILRCFLGARLLSVKYDMHLLPRSLTRERHGRTSVQSIAFSLVFARGGPGSWFGQLASVGGKFLGGHFGMHLTNSVQKFVIRQRTSDVAVATLSRVAAGPTGEKDACEAARGA